MRCLLAWVRPIPGGVNLPQRKVEPGSRECGVMVPREELRFGQLIEHLGDLRVFTPQ